MDGFAVKEPLEPEEVAEFVPRIRPVRKCTFLCREAAITILGPQGLVSRSAFFQIPKRQWTDVDMKSIRYNSKNVHGLGIIPAKTECPQYQQHQLGDVMREWYKLTKSITHLRRPVIAYKGGIYECDMLRAMCIPSLDLENFGCKKAEQLSELFPEVQQHHHQCHMQNHSWAKLPPGKVLHCPRWEVALFAEYIHSCTAASRAQRKRTRQHCARAAAKRQRRRNQLQTTTIEPQLIEDKTKDKW